MRVYNAASTYADLKDVEPTTNEDTANIVIVMTTEDGLDPHKALALFLDSMIDVAEQIHAKAHPDDVTYHEFPYRPALEAILTSKGM